MPRKTHQFEGEVVEYEERSSGPNRVKIVGNAEAGFEKTEKFDVWPTVFASQDKGDDTKVTNPAIRFLAEGSKVRVTYFNKKNGDYWNKVVEEAESLNGTSQNGSSGAVTAQEAPGANIRSIPEDWVDGLLEAVSATVVNYVASVGVAGVSPSASAVPPKIAALIDGGVSEQLIETTKETLFSGTPLTELNEQQTTALASVLGAKV